MTQDFVNSTADTSLFVRNTGRDITYILVYVDDMIVTTSNTGLISSIIANLLQCFSLKDLGELSYFLDIEATRTKKGLHLMQKKYVIDLLTWTNMLRLDQAPLRCLL